MHAGADRVSVRAGVGGGGGPVGGQQQPPQALALRLPGPPRHGSRRHCHRAPLPTVHVPPLLICIAIYTSPCCHACLSLQAGDQMAAWLWQHLDKAGTQRQPQATRDGPHMGTRLNVSVCEFGVEFLSPARVPGVDLDSGRPHPGARSSSASHGTGRTRRGLANRGSRDGRRSHISCIL